MGQNVPPRDVPDVRQDAEQNSGMFNTNSTLLNTGVLQSVAIGFPRESILPIQTPSIFDPVGDHIPIKIKEKIWAGEYIDLRSLLKSAKDLATESELNGDLTVKGGQLTVVPHRQGTITNIHIWTSAYIIFMGIMLEKWPGKGQEYLKYMYNIRLASTRGFGMGWTLYDEQYRLR